MFGVDPWKLMTWMGHKRIAGIHLRTHPPKAERGPAQQAKVAMAPSGGTGQTLQSQARNAARGEELALGWPLEQFATCGHSWISANHLSCGIRNCAMILLVQLQQTRSTTRSAKLKACYNAGLAYQNGTYGAAVDIPKAVELEMEPRCRSLTNIVEYLRATYGS